MVVELTYAGIILTSFTFIDVELTGREGKGLFGHLQSQGGVDNSVWCLLLRIFSEMASAGLGFGRTGDLSLSLNRPCSSRTGGTI
jgi:hypothetical protein